MKQAQAPGLGIREGMAMDGGKRGIMLLILAGWG